MPKIGRKVLAVLALVVGAGVMVFEVKDFQPGFESWFWMGVAGLTVILAGAELFSKQTPLDPP